MDILIDVMRDWDGGQLDFLPEIPPSAMQRDHVDVVLLAYFGSARLDYTNTIIPMIQSVPKGIPWVLVISVRSDPKVMTFLGGQGDALPVGTPIYMCQYSPNMDNIPITPSSLNLVKQLVDDILKL